MDKGLNQMQEIKSASAQDIEAVIELPGHRKKFEIAVKEARGEVCITGSLSVMNTAVYYIGLPTRSPSHMSKSH